MVFRPVKHSPAAPPWSKARIQPVYGSKERNLFSEPVGRGGRVQAPDVLDRDLEQIAKQREERYRKAKRNTWLDDDAKWGK